MHVGSDLVVARDDERREVLLVDGRVAVRRRGDGGRGDAGYLAAALEGAGEMRHCSCGVVELLLQSVSANRASGM